MTFGGWSIFLHVNWQQGNRNLSTKISLPLPKPHPFLIPEFLKMADPPPSFTFPFQLILCQAEMPCFLTHLSLASARQEQRLRLGSPGLTDAAAPLASPTKAHSHVVIELSLCFLFDKINWLSLCVLSNLKDHHHELPASDKASQFSALIPILVVVCFTAPGPDCQNPQSSCSKTELVFCF